jgi:rRNA maturation endonuclease Nob1
MAQELVYETVEIVEESSEEIPEALTVCKECKHLVPKTMLCLWCGSPILFKTPKTAS